MPKLSRVSRKTLTCLIVLTSLVVAAAAEGWTWWARTAGGDQSEGIEYRFITHYSNSGGWCSVRFRDTKPSGNHWTSLEFQITYADPDNHERTQSGSHAIASYNHEDDENHPAAVIKDGCSTIREVRVSSADRRGP